MKTKYYHKRIDGYLATLKTDSDKLTQFYDACITAKKALIEIDILNSKLEVATQEYWIEKPVISINL